MAEKERDMLGPCPFCGGADINHERRAMYDDAPRPVFECSDCGAQGPVGSRYGGFSRARGDEVELGNRLLWNTRASSPQEGNEG